MENQMNGTESTVKQQFDAYIEKYNNYCDDKVALDKKEQNITKLLSSIRMSQKSGCDRIKEALEKKKEESEKKKVIAVTGIIFGIVVQLIFAVIFKNFGVLEKTAHTSSFRWGFLAFYIWGAVLSAGILTIAYALFMEGKKEFKKRAALRKQFLLVVFCFFAAIVAVGVIHVTAKWGWGNGIPGPSLTVGAEWGFAILSSLPCFVVAVAGWCLVGKNIPLLATWSSCKIFKSNGFDADIQDVNNYFSADDKGMAGAYSLSEAWNRVVELRNAKMKNAQRKEKINTPDLPEALYIAEWNKKQQSIITKIEYQKQPVVFLYEKPEGKTELSEILDLLCDLVVSVADAFSIFNPINSKIYVVDFLNSGNGFAGYAPCDDNKSNDNEIEDNKIPRVKITSIDPDAEKEKFFNVLNDIVKQYAGVMGTDVKTIADYNRKVEYFDEVKDFHIVNFIFKPSGGPGAGSIECLEEKWWSHILNNCYRNGVLPIYYLEKGDWEKQKEDFGKKLGKEVWCVTRENESFFLEKYSDSKNVKRKV